MVGRVLVVFVNSEEGTKLNKYDMKRNGNVLRRFLEIQNLFVNLFRIRILWQYKDKPI